MRTPFSLPSNAAAVALAALLACAAPPAAAAVDCDPVAADGSQRCMIGLPAVRLAGMHRPQGASEWCWAASISIVLARHGVQVSQPTVVRTQFGAEWNRPVTPRQLTMLLERDWRDEATGRVAHVEALPLPPGPRAAALAAPEIVRELGDDRPVLIGVQNHAMVLVQLVVQRPGRGRRGDTEVLRAVVLDPAREPGIRSLHGRELRPESILRVHVTVPASPGAPW